MWDSIKRIDDQAENVAKFVFAKGDAVAESVLYRYPTYAERTVICCSTQSGCPVGCRFCGAGDYFVRSLTAEEIVSQPDHLLSLVDCRPEEMGRLQIMFMSMGEPLLNLKALIPAMDQLYAKYPTAALLISTIGPNLPQRGWDDLFAASVRIPTIGLQFSVHESTDVARRQLIPFSAKLNLASIATMGEKWAVATGRRPFFNYCAHDGNESDADANRILALLDPAIWCATVSVICERGEGMEARNQHQRDLATSFAGRLAERGYDTRVFDPAGQDTIGGGCGQLWFVQQWMKDNPDKARPSIGHGRPEVHVPAAV